MKGFSGSKTINFNRALFSGMLILFIFNAFNPTPRLEIRESPLIRADFEVNEKLQADADALLLPFFDNMTPVPVYLKDEPVIKSGTNTERGVAYTFCEDFERPTIIVKKDFYRKANPKQLANILKHELTHAWLCRQKQMSGHDERFRQKFTEVGGFGN